MKLQYNCNMSYAISNIAHLLAHCAQPFPKQDKKHQEEE
jgi:hypothetical protein